VYLDRRGIFLLIETCNGKRGSDTEIINRKIMVGIRRQPTPDLEQDRGVGGR